jgi:hypothetical protein
MNSGAKAMIRTLSRTAYALTVVALLGGTGWTATGIKSDRLHSQGGLGIVLLAALQR